MKKSLLVLAAFVATSAPAFAQAPTTPASAATAQRSPDDQAARRAQYLARELGLSADQQARLEPILLAQRQEMMAMRTQVQTGGRRAGMGQELKTAQAKYSAQIKAVLTPEQATKFDQLRDEQRATLRERRAAGGPGLGGQR